MLAQAKLVAAVTAEVSALLLLGAEATSGLLPDGALDAGTTVAALGLLAYILRLMFSGDLISKTTIESVVEKAVRETLAETRREQGG